MSVVTIRQIGGAGLRVTLQDGTLPVQGVTEATKLQFVRVDYPGSFASSVQVMGSADEPIQFDGWFRDNDLGSGGAESAHRSARALMLQHSLCELTWGQQVVKRGFVAEYEARWYRSTELRYRLVFEVIESDEAEVIAVERPSDPTQSDIARALGLAAADASQAAAARGILLATSALYTVLPETPV